MDKTALIIGAMGGIGSAAAAALLAHGWSVRALNRDPARAAGRRPELAEVDWIEGDALDRDEVLAAATGSSAILHAANPPNYKNWRGLALPMLRNAIDAAVAGRARLAFPGNVYNFDPAAAPAIAEDTPETPRSRKGAIRIEMEAMLQEAVARGARALIVRAGDFFGPNAPGSWFSSVMVRRDRTLGSVVYPGDPDVGHAWAYLPDLAETFAGLLDREADLGGFEVFHFGGHFFEKGVELAEAILCVAGAPRGRVKAVLWAVVQAASPFVPLFRELREMRYLWRKPLRLENRKLVAFLGEEPHTPLDDALRATLAAHGCLG